MSTNEAAAPRLQATGILATAAMLALLYFGREVLVPVMLALFLGALLSPWVRFCLRLGLGHGFSVLLVVLATLAITLGMALVLGSQATHLARSLPQYQSTIHAKMQTLRGLTIDRFESMQGELGRVIEPAAEPVVPGQAAAVATVPGPASSPATVPAAMSSASLGVLSHLLTVAWVPLQTGGIVLVVLAFVLLEQESLRDRFIRLAGGADLRATTMAINDAAERLSRFFISTFSVNTGVGVAIGAGLWLIGLPNALLWGALAAILRFVPYVGVWLVAALTMLFAAAVGPDWSLVVMTGILFATVELVVSQVIEPLLYGHTTGLSPLAVVVSAIFWSWLWGPVGLVMSTPLTLCLVVAGRHVKALDLLTILLGDAPALTMPQRLYQRALSGDAQEILDDARRYLKRRTFGAYCDTIVLPALQFGRMDLERGVIRAEQLRVLRETIVTVIGTLGGEGRTRAWRKRPQGVLSGENIGRQLRQRREQARGRWQGPLAVPAGSIALCMSMGTDYDDLTTELLTRVLLGLNVDARHLSPDDLHSFDDEPHPELTPGAVALIYLVDTAPEAMRERVDALAVELRQRMPAARIIVLCLPGLLAPSASDLSACPHVDAVAGLLEEAAQYALPIARQADAQAAA
ncbi:AI-2E family transporter [Rhodanobacter sp. DHB23]|uniref:AI-2E family transporter n=1 Tax=Rhodanobacter sp. DHB23 TaxID=2775923 RepID=UPI00177FB601|nr:AI-2E family transporter [Rhodanobacter sp. DHB23]MBD8873621.1 AI-2E family transporter [Rhodanobacter sp. DHB23]